MKPSSTVQAGQRFSSLTVIDGSLVMHLGRPAILCRCDCGKEVVVRRNRLWSGHTKSCGCIKSKRIGDLNRTHGQRRTPLYRLWAGMVNRCCNPNNSSYAYYGGRGIRVCDLWRNDFEAFARDMGERPSPEYTLDRIDNNGNYEPGNVRWATRLTQSRNRRPMIGSGQREAETP